MLLLAALYALANVGGEGSSEWGVPMATDRAFALGILALLGDRVPSSLRVFLAALAIADELGAALVIAVFYTRTLSVPALVGAGVVLMALFGLNRAGARRPVSFGALWVVLWLFLLASGIHATVAGVLLALMIPARTRLDNHQFLRHAEASLADFCAADEPGTTVLTNPGHREALQALEHAADAAHAPLQQMEHALYGVVAFGIMPIFALANAGISFGAGASKSLRSPIALGIALGLLIGNPLGITGATYLAVRSGVADLPGGASWRHIHGASWLGGIGFTMSLFIAGLAFRSSAQLDIAKLAVLGASTLAGVIGYAVLRRAAKTPALPWERA
ncbi:MAG: Na+/H+ antiporter NhaA [Gemmatimonadaceae bacterium]